MNSLITIQTLVAAGIGPTQARLFADPLVAASMLYGIDTPARIAAFVAQAAHESVNFTRLEENLYYSNPERILQVFRRLRSRGLSGVVPLTRNPQALGNAAYAGINGNGSEASGDGWRYRGRGLFQLTGRANYQAAQEAIGRPYISQPDLVAQPSDAVLTAAWYWHSNGCNEMADAGAIDQITRAINGPAMLAAAERRNLFDDALRAFIFA